MHDIRWIRENPEAFDAGLAKRGADPVAQTILALDRDLRACKTALQDDQARRNEASKAIGGVKAKGGDAGDLIAEVSALKARIQETEERERTLTEDLENLMAGLPNLPADDVPDGVDESDNVEIRRVGEAPSFDFEPKEHFDIGEGLGLMDFETAAKLSGSRFVVLSGAMARLERALGLFMLDVHTTEFGYTEISPPVLVRDEAAYGTANLPKFAEDLFHTDNGYWLIPTAEMPLTNLVRESIVDPETLPRRYTARTHCFRSEAGAAGKDTRGMIRQHQFIKVELVSVTTPETSEDEHERMTSCAEEILKRLGLHYRVVTLCAGDMGATARKTYDIEVWLPGQGQYREISSCSNCGDYQARRMRARYKPEGEKNTRFVHTLNGSGLAVGRTLVAVLENYQRADGSVAVPEALQGYMGGMTEIRAAG